MSHEHNHKFKTEQLFAYTRYEFIENSMEEWKLFQIKNARQEHSHSIFCNIFGNINLPNIIT